MMPPTTPIRNAPNTPRPPTRDRRACNAGGRFSSNAPNIDAAIAAKNSASGTMTHGFARNVPNALPSSANTVPSAPNMAAIPATYAVASASARPRFVRSLAPKILIVIGIIG